MRRGTDLIGMKVVAQQSGDKLGRVMRVIIHDRTMRVAGFLLRRAGWFQKSRIVPFTKVLSIADVITTDSTEDALADSDELLEAKRLLDRNVFVSVPLFAANGHEIGRALDFYFDEHSGELEGFEVVVGSSEHAVYAPAFLPVNDDIIFEKSSVIVGGEAANRLLFDVKALQSA